MNKIQGPNNLLKALFIADIAAAAAYLVLLIGFPELGVLDNVLYGYKTPFVNNQRYYVVIAMAAITWMNLYASVYCAAHDILHKFIARQGISPKLKLVFGLEWWVYLIFLFIQFFGYAGIESFFARMKTYDRVWMDMAQPMLLALTYMAIFITGSLSLQRSAAGKRLNE